MPRAAIVPTRIASPGTALRTALRALALPLAIAAAPPAHAVTFNTTYAASVTTSPYAAQIQAGFQAAAQAYQAIFVNPVTVNIHVGWGELLGSPVTSLGVAGMYGSGSYGYSQVQTMLRATATSSTDTAAYAAMPTASPAGSLNYTLTPALAKALGVAPATSSGTDGYIGFGSTYSFDFNRADGISAGAYDFTGVALHEISHVLGRVSGLGSSTPRNAMPIDAFRYAAPGTPTFNYSTPAYFSIDGGATNLANFASGAGQERDSWVHTPGDAFSYAGTAGLVNDLTTADRILMDVLGWNTVAGTTTPVYGTPTTTTGGGGKPKPGKRTMLGDIADPAEDLLFATTEVPEPASMALLGAALLCLGIASRRRPS